MNNMTKYGIVAVLIVAVASLLFVAYSSANKGKSTGPAGCFAIPAAPNKTVVLQYINLTKAGSVCALAALRGYQSANILSRYNITINITQLSRYVNQTNQTGIYH